MKSSALATISLTVEREQKEKKKRKQSNHFRGRIKIAVFEGEAANASELIWTIFRKKITLRGFPHNIAQKKLRLSVKI